MTTAKTIRDKSTTELAKTCNATTKILALNLGNTRKRDGKDEEQVDKNRLNKFKEHRQSGNKNESASKVLNHGVETNVETMELPVNEPKD